MTSGFQKGQKQKPLRLGYFVPEFPGQTHIFFWREIERLESLGVDVRIVSTRLPPKKITSHSWSEAAKARTNYLHADANIMTVLSLIVSVFSFGPLAWFKVFRSILKTRKGRESRRHLLLFSFFGAKLAKLAKRERWTHLQVHSAANAANVALYAKLLSGLPYSITLHGPLSDYGSNQPEKWGNADFGIVITNKLYKEIREELGIDATRYLAIAPMGVNLNVFKRSKPYEPWDGTSPAKLYSVGRLNVCKGHDHLIQAVGILRDRKIPVHLHIAGEDEFGGTGYHQELDALIAQWNLRSEVTLLGAVSEQVIRSGLEDSQIFALASLHEPLGVAIMEAMALEMPVVVTGSGGVKELVDDGIDGKLVNPNDPEGLADAIELLLKNPELCDRLAKNSREKIARGFQDTRSAEVLVASILRS